MEKKDFIFLSVLFILFLLMYCFSQGSTYGINSDIGRELYIPWQMNQGEILYKDIFNVYPPLGYIVNAFFLKLFNNLNIIGFIASYIILIAIYVITKIYTERICALILCTLIIFGCIFYPGISNYITPYSYSLLYAMSAFLWAFLMLVLYLKNEKIRYYFLSCFLFSLSISFKYEYILFLFVLIFIALYKKIGVKNFVYSIISIISLPLLSLFILLIQGLGLNDLNQSVKYILNLSHSESVKYFYTYAGFIPSVGSVKNSLLSIINIFNSPSSIKFLFTGYLSVILLFIIRKREITVIILSITTVLCSLKCIGAISLELYGTFFLPLILINFCALFYPFKKLYIILLCFLCLFTGFYFNNDINKIKSIRQNVINTNSNEKIYTDNEYFAKRYNYLIDYIINNTDKNDTVLVLPEGVMLNYLTKRKSDNMLYYLIPPNTEIFGNEKIINRIKNNAPEIIIIFNNKYPWYNTTSFSNGWGSEIFNFINKYYKIEEEVSSDYDRVYRKNGNI